MSKLIDAGREVLGTCREAKENFDFDQLVKKYDRHTAEMLVSDQLKNGDISLDEFRTYKKVKTFVQNGGLDVSQAHKEAQKAASDALASDGFKANAV
ncbi:hypothetical protein EV679_3259 [Kerstersia gyiorum]|jgi:hypothetical protein|uniref:Uncharacterized protein n=1 Tax=Kerstersia gyiorum TaxID=206506 RepID=A0A4Q7MAH6_9BURK|nr:MULTISPECIES: hypothetical protein [Betaproteobacteria]KAB0542121.1 hypothetical protein F7P85_14930 [Kerstersia gyiorum]RZS64914.1 hypothetical protein EV679_3259 [Kerstersia gyiorum]